MKNYNIDIKINDPLIIMGNGPSLKNIDFNILKDKDTFGVKDAYRIYPKINWYPKYWGAFDIEWFYTNNNLAKIEEFILLNKCYCFLPQWDLYKKDFDNILCMPFTSKICKNVNGIPHHDLVIYGGGSSTHNACRIGINLGYKKIILIGVDCTYTGTNMAPYFDKDIPNIPLDLTVLRIKYNKNSYDELFNHINKQQGNDLLDLSKEYPNIDFVNCGGELSHVDIFRRNKLENEL